MSMKMVYNDPNEIDYSEILKKLPNLLELIRSCYDASDYKRAIDVSYEIGKLYAPSDDHAGSKIAYLIQAMAGTMYFGGMEEQKRQSAKIREASFTPPF